MTHIALPVYILIGLYMASQVPDGDRPDGVQIALMFFMAALWPLFLFGMLVGRAMR